jgi:DNA replication protein DnaC
MQMQAQSTWRSSPVAPAQPGCGICHGTGWQLFSGAGISRARRCACLALQRKILLREQVHIPSRYDHCVLNNYEPITVSQVKALGEMQRIVERFPRFERDLFLTGDPGVGKTHLAVAALVELLQRQRDDLLFVDLAVLPGSAGSGMAPDSSDFHRMKSVSLLVLDGFDPAEARDELWDFLSNLHSARRRSGRPTLLTSRRLGTGNQSGHRRKDHDINNSVYPSRFQMRFIMQWMSCAKTVAIHGPDRRPAAAPLF